VFAVQVSAPEVGPNLVDKNASIISESREKMKKQIFSKYTIPYILNTIDSKPQIFKDSEYTMENGISHLTVNYRDIH
jgi:hypothetical protein